MSEWPKKVTVDKRIVQILSSQTYENFPKALKELITNSYDADATKVNVEIDLQNEEILIEDNGFGISEKDFDFYLRIAFRTREKSETTKSGRKIVGQFGVGFLSIFPFCEKYHIESKKRGSSEIIFADIPCSRYFTEEKKLIDVSEIAIPGGKKSDERLIDQQFTRIKLAGFTKLTQTFLSKSKVAPNKYSIQNFKGLDKLKWILSEDLPVAFAETKYNKWLNNAQEYPFEVFLNGENLTRKVYGNTVLEIQKNDFEKIGKIKFKYFIATNYSVIHPTEARFFKIRNLNVGVGERASFGAGTETGTRARLNHLTGEIHIIDGLNELISVKRDDFNYSEDYENLKNYFRDKLSTLAIRLDKIADFDKFVRETENDFKINDLNLLEHEALTSKIKNLVREGFKIKNVVDNSIKSKPIRVDKEKKQIILSSPLSSFSKRIILKEKEYHVKVEKWDFNDPHFPACKIDDDCIILNKSYPLFKGKKYTDVFFRLHMLLLINYRDNIIDRASYSKLIKDILQLYKDYL